LCYGADGHHSVLVPIGGAANEVAGKIDRIQAGQTDAKTFFKDQDLVCCVMELHGDGAGSWDAAR